MRAHTTPRARRRADDRERGARRARRRLLAVAVALAVLDGGRGSGATAAETAVAAQLTPLLATALATPMAVPQSDGRWQLPYELEVTNVTAAPLTIESVTVLPVGGGSGPVLSLSAEQVAAHLAVPGVKQTATLGPGQSGLLYVNPAFSRREDIPATLEHRIVVTTPQEEGSAPRRVDETVARTAVVATPPLVLGPPLRGERWIATASCCDSYHRRAALPLNGARHLAQRFAIDWIQLDAENRLASGDPKRNESYPQFGAEVLAVADGTVAHVADGLPEGTPGSFPPNLPLAQVDGNSVVLDLGGGRWALFAHLQPGTIRVAPGDRVRRGQVLGLAGNTGNSDAPHLHFHVMDGPSPLASNGIPYVIDSFEVTGRVVSTSDLEDELEVAGQPVQVVAVEGAAQRTEELPADLVVVRFTEPAAARP